MAKRLKNNQGNLLSTDSVNEPVMRYKHAMVSLPKIKLETKEFTYKEFKRIAHKIDFTLAEWAELLFTSERTLQRYSKTNASFNGLQIERILLLEKLIENGKLVFGKNFEQWLKEPSFKYQSATPYSQLFSYAGILNVIQYLGQLEHGILP